LHRNDLVGKKPCFLCCCHSLLRLQGIFILIFPTDIIPLRDDIGGLDHWHEDRRRNLQDLLVDRSFRCPGPLHRDAFHTAGHNTIGAIAANMVCGHRNRLHAGRAEPVDRRARGRLGKTSEKRRIAADIGSAVRHIADQAIIDKIDFDPRFLHSMLDRMRRHCHRRCDVEAAATRLGEPCAGIRYDDSFTHAEFSL